MKIIDLSKNLLFGHTYLPNKEDFHWYKQDLDVTRRYEHRHTGEPEEYPCTVVSAFWDDPNGPYTYEHNFAYQAKTESPCSACGHVDESWYWQI